MLRAAHLISVLSASLLGASCRGPPCHAQSECPFGTHCVLDIEESGAPNGSCEQECVANEDCPAAESRAARAICSNQGQCRVEARPPRIALFEPEPDTPFSEGTRRVRVSGEVESAADRIGVSVSVLGASGCRGGGRVRQITLENPNPGEFSTVPFVVDGVPLDTGMSSVSVSATVEGSRRTATVDVNVPCPGCAAIGIEAPLHNHSAPGLFLDGLRGRIAPAVARGVWRVHGLAGVFDGVFGASSGAFEVERLPLFAGYNQVEIVVSGVGEGLGESRCSVGVSSAVSIERGLRIVLAWDGSDSDLDLHLVGPGGRFGDPERSLSSRSPAPSFGGRVLDDFDGLGPEILALDPVPDGVYGLVVEPVLDGPEGGSSALLRVLSDGRSMLAGPVGPEFLSADLGVLWIVGTLLVSGETTELRLIEEVVSASRPPTTSPEDWPRFF